MRFDEVELEAVPLGGVDEFPADEQPAGRAPRLKRLFALATDMSLFVAVALALSPLLPASAAVTELISGAAFIVLLSYYYFAGSWLLWGKTVGGAIFDVRIVPERDGAMSLQDASLRWAGVYLSLLTCGLGFALAALPSARSLPDRISNTRCI